MNHLKGQEQLMMNQKHPVMVSRFVRATMILPDSIRKRDFKSFLTQICQLKSFNTHLNMTSGGSEDPFEDLEGQERTMKSEEVFNFRLKPSEDSSEFELEFLMKWIFDF